MSAPEDHFAPEDCPGHVKRPCPTPDGGRWLDIKDAPREQDAEVDLWIVDNQQVFAGSTKRDPERQYRIADCHYSPSGGGWCAHDGVYVTGKRYYDNFEGDYLFDPSCTDGNSAVATHFMFKPKGPNE